MRKVSDVAKLGLLDTEFFGAFGEKLPFPENSEHVADVLRWPISTARRGEFTAEVITPKAWRPARQEKLKQMDKVAGEGARSSCRQGRRQLAGRPDGEAGFASDRRIGQRKADAAGASIEIATGGSVNEYSRIEILSVLKQQSRRWARRRKSPKWGRCSPSATAWRGFMVWTTCAPRNGGPGERH